VLALACAAPGPTVAALLARVLGRGPAGAPAFCAGLLASDALWLTGAVLGLAALAETAAPLFQVVKYAGAAYLLWLAWTLWRTPATVLAGVAPARGEGWRLLAAGVAVGSGNPKTMLFYFALLPTVLPLERVTAVDWAVLVAVQVAVYGAVLAGYGLLAARARRLLASPRALRLVHRASGATMAGAAVAIATRP